MSRYHFILSVPIRTDNNRNQHPIFSYTIRCFSHILIILNLKRMTLEFMNLLHRNIHYMFAGLLSVLLSCKNIFIPLRLFFRIKITPNPQEML